MKKNWLNNTQEKETVIVKSEFDANNCEICGQLTYEIICGTCKEINC